MGCGSCRTGKVFMPKITNFENMLIKDYSPLISSHFSGPNESYASISKTIAKHQSEFQENPIEINGLLSPCIGNYSERSQKSQEINTVSKEFRKFMVQYSENNKFLPQSEYKIFVWTNNREMLRKLFPERTIIERIQIENNLQDVTFTIYTANAPVLVDCVLYILTKIEEFKEVYNLNQKFKHVWTQGLITSIDHPNFNELAETLGINIFKKTSELFTKICADDLKLFYLLREIFNKIDSNHSGEIEFSELYNAIKQIQPEIIEEDIKEAIARIDINNDGTISFEEFCFWWKKGRQGAVSLSELALKWARQISLATPETRVLVKNITKNRPVIEKRVIKKEILMKVGQEFESATQIFIEIGKSAIRERLLNELNMKLALFSKDLWVSFKIKAKSGALANIIEKKLKKGVENLINSLFSDLLDGKKLKKAIKHDTKVFDSDVYITFVLELNDSYLEPLNKLLLTIDEFLTSPMNDFINCTINFKNKLFKLLRNGNLLENCGDQYEVNIESEFWSKYISILLSIFPISSKFHGILYSFFLFAGKSEFTFNNASDASETIESIIGKKIEFHNVLRPSIIELISILEKDIEDSIEVFGRVSNIGIKLKIVSQDLFLNFLLNP